MRDLGTCVLLASVVSAPHDIKCLAYFLTGRMIHSHVYKPTVWPVNS